MRIVSITAVVALGLGLASVDLKAQTPPPREQVSQALRKAVEFYRTKVSTHGGYHFTYTEDLSYGRSEQSETPHQVEVQREGTPIVGMAYLEAYAATGDRYYLEAAREVASTYVKGQHCSGGWDYYIEFDPELRKKHPYRADGNCAAGTSAAAGYTTLDDNVTQASVRFLMRTDRDLGFQDEKIHEATRYALDQLIRAQYPNGAWPQRYFRFPDPSKFPVKRASYPDAWSRTWPAPDYRGHYTLNDNTVADMIDTMLEAARIYNEPRYRASAERGGEFILMAQMPDPQPAWAQQYDADMHPAWARIFEPPAVTGGESQSAMRILLVLYRETGNRKYLEPLPRAIDYLRRSVLPEVDRPLQARARFAKGTPVLARFYELKTNRPLYITKGTRVNVLHQSATIVDGYQLSYSDESVITHYGVLTNGSWLEPLAEDYKSIAAADSASLKRSDRLHGLSPWSARSVAGSTAAQLAPRVSALLAAMDARGAWVEEGTIGKAERLVSLFAAKDMIVTIGDTVLPLKENQTLQVFPGGDRPRQRVISSQTFAANVETLSAYLKAQ